MREGAATWLALKRWQRRELGQALRHLGLSYREIAQIVPVHKGTLSGWCRDIRLTTEQTARLRALNNARAGRRQAGSKLRSRNLERVEAIRAAARAEAAELLADPFWVAGVVAYWAEGAKRKNQVEFSNSDPNLVVVFILWASIYLRLTPERFTIRLHLHAGQTEDERKAYWSGVTGLPLSQFRKTFIKPEGTGHRKNVLYNGTASVRVTRSTDLLHRVMGWVDAVSQSLSPLG